MAWFKRVFGIPTVIGCMIGSGFVVPLFWIVSIVGIAWCIEYSKKPSAIIQGYCSMWWIWTVKSIFAISFIWSVYPITWLGFPLGPLEPLMILFYWGTVAAWLGFGGVALYGGMRLVQKAPIWSTYILIPMVWLLSELVGSLLFSLFTYGPGGNISTQFSFGYIGYLLVEHQWLIQLAQFAGVFSLTLCAVGLALLVTWLWHNRQFVAGAAVILLLLTSSLITYPHSAAVSTPSYSVATVDTLFPKAISITAEGQSLMRDQLQSALEAALAADVDYVIFPEDSRVFDQSNLDYLRAYLSFRYGATDTIIIDSGRVQYDNQSVLQAMIYDGTGPAIYEAHKRYLVPQGEFLPYFSKSVLQLAGYQSAIDLLEEKLAYRVGKDTSQSDFVSNVPGILFCFESNDPLGVRTIMRERGGDVPFIAHVISHAWFNNPRVLWQQTEAMLRIQAIWNNVHIVSVGNHASGYTVSPAGVITYPTTIDTGEYWQLRVTEVPVR